MADTVKLPAIGNVDKRWVYIGGAGILGFVGYAWWNRARTGPAEQADFTEEDIPQGREPPPTVVGSESFEDSAVTAIINTNSEWYTAAIEYLVGTGGFDFTFATITLGKFLARRELTEQEANLVQAAKGAVGEPPQGGPWPIIRGTVPGPTPTGTKLATPTLKMGIGDPKNTYYQLSWTKVAGATHYAVKRELGPGAPAYALVTGTTRRVGPLKRRYEYQYRVQAQALGKPASAWSNPVRWKVPAK
jgi:hypothetical protein